MWENLRFFRYIRISASLNVGVVVTCQCYNLGTVWFFHVPRVYRKAPFEWLHIIQHYYGFELPHTWRISGYPLEY
jgi:hypothetical protein